MLELFLRLGLGDDQAGDERADDRGQADIRRDERQREHEHERRHERRFREHRPGEHLPLDAAGATGCRESEPDQPERRHQDEERGLGLLAGGRAGHESDRDQGEDVVDHRGAEDDARERLVEHAQLAEDPARDPDARGAQGEADERGRLDLGPDRQPEPDPGRDRQDHRDDRGQHGRPTHRQQVVEAHLQPDREQQDDHAELGEDRGGLAGDDEPEGIGSDGEATEQLADDGGLTQAARDLLAELRADEQDEQAEQDVGRRLGGGRGRGHGRPDLTEGQRVRHRGPR